MIFTTPILIKVVNC